MKRPVVVWTLCALIILGIIWDLVDLFVGRIALSSLSFISIMISAITLLLIIPRIVLIINFFKLKKKAKLWAHLSFGLILGLAIINYIVNLVHSVAPSSLLLMAFYAILWWAVVDYVNKTQIDNKPLFN